MRRCHLHWTGTLAPPPRWVMWQGKWYGVKVMRPVVEFCCFINTSQYKHTPSTWNDKFSFCQLACNYHSTCAQNVFLQARICSRVAVWYIHCQSDISGDIGESTSTTSGASAPDDKTATVQYRVSLLSRRFMSPVTWPTRGWGQGPCSVQVASPHKVFVTF